MLRDAGFRATPRRISLLSTLGAASTPLTVPEVRKNMKKSIDAVTVYRALEAFTLSGIVRRVDLQHSHAHYELVAGKKHHHHLVCSDCGSVEDIAMCAPEPLQKAVLKKSKGFSSIISHSMEFFGICRKCQLA
jgi:Fur family ferric uptake transcriptional regulator